MPAKKTNKKSSPGCPGEVTVGSGLGPNQIPFVVPKGSGKLTAEQTRVLLRDFNDRLGLLAFVHCVVGGCIPNWIPASESDIVYDTRNWKGWYDVYHIEVTKKAVAAGTAAPPSTAHPIYA